MKISPYEPRQINIRIWVLFVIPFISYFYSLVFF